MAATAVVNVRTQPVGGKRVNYCTVTFDSSYPAGGESVAANLLGLKRIEQVIIGNAVFSSTEANIATAEVAAGGATVAIKLYAMGASAAQGVEPLETNVTGQATTTVSLIAVGV